jgi:5'-nucleotidase
VSVQIRTAVVAGALTVAVLAGCSGSDAKDSTSTSSSPAAADAKPLDILVSNDDGYAAPGLDVLVEALRKLPNVRVTVSAPAINESGTGSQVVTGKPTATKQKTKSGYPATAVKGFPADSVTYGLENVVDTKPHLVVSGINQGQNLGPIATSISGTVGAAKAALAAGIPALAASQGAAETPDYASGAQYVVAWVEAHRAALIARTAAKAIVNVNIPTCETGSIRGMRVVPLSDDGPAAVKAKANCGSSETKVADDAAAFSAGFATATQLDLQGQTVTTSTTTWPRSG